MRTLLLLGAQLADGLTASLRSEVNPIAAGALASGTGLAIKLALVALVLSAALALRATRKYRRLEPILVYAGILVGIVGTLSNL